MTVLGYDRSHWQAAADYAALKAAGVGFVIAKCTDGLTYDDAAFDAARAGAEAVGLVFGGYHFAEWGDPVAEARHFLARMSPRPGELVALDCEAALPAGVDPVAWALHFCATVNTATGAWPLVYLNQSWLAAHDWSALAAHDGLWLAKYDGLTTGGPTGAWPVMAVKQFTDAASLPGQPGRVDEDAFQGSLAALLKYAVPVPAPAPPPPPPPAPAPAPAPSPGGSVLDATDLQNIHDVVWHGPGDLGNAGNPPVWMADRLIGVDTKTGVLNALPGLIDTVSALKDAVAQLAAPPATDVAALAAAIVADPGFPAVVAAVIAARDTALAKALSPGA